MTTHIDWRAIVIFLTGLSLSLAACANGTTTTTPSPATESPAPQLAPPDRHELVATGTSFEFVESIEAEPVVIEVRNESEETTSVFFARMNEDVTLDQVREAFETGGDEAALELIVPAGAAEAGPGETSELTIQFPAGNYLAIGEGDEQPAVFEVTAATGPGVAEPEADLEIEMGEFYFRPSGPAPAGTITILLTNAGEQGHEIIAAPGTLDEILESEGEFEGSFFSLAPAPGGRIWITAELSPETYTMVCFFDDPDSGKPHFELGMTGPLEVAAS
jgi:hypothetical protein